MKKPLILLLACLLPGTAICMQEDSRQLVELPPMMQQHMLGNMRDHLAAIDEILAHLAGGEFDRAAQVAEQRLGMTSLQSHGAEHMARFMPTGMQAAGTEMHRAASRFALKAEEGDTAAALRALGQVTSACVACHTGYRIH